MAYPNATINEGGFGSFYNETGSTIALYTRCKFVSGTSPDGKPSLAVCANSERGDVIAMADIPTATYGQVRFLNAQGEQFGIVVAGAGGIALAGDVYTDANGQFSSNSGGGNLKVGKATIAGADTCPFTWIPLTPAA